MPIKIRIFRILFIFILITALEAGVFPRQCLAFMDEVLSFIPSKTATSEEDQEEEKDASRAQTVDKLLTKARKLRYQKNFRSARAHAEKALKIDPDNPLALAFLEQLSKEEEIHQEDLKRLKEEKEEAKRRKKLEKEAKKREREEAKQRKLAEREALKKKKEEEQAAKEKAKLEAKAKKKAELEARRKKVEEEAPPAPERKVEEKVPPVPEEEVGKEAPPVPAKKVEEEITVPEEKKVPPEEKRPPAKEEEKKEEKIPSAVKEEDLFKMKPGQPIIVDGDKVEYFEEDGRIKAEGNVSITYGDVKLTCDYIEVNTKGKVALCEGNVRIEQADGTLTGDRIRYDFGKKEGEIIGAEVKAYPWFGQAEETGKVGPNEYLLKKGFITTCDLDKPHYRISAGEIRVFPDEKVIAKNAVFYLGKVPVLWVPYYYHPIIQSRAKVQFIPGWNSDWGYFLLSASRFYIKGNTKVDVLLDYRTQKGFAEGANLYYFMEDFGLPDLGEGIFRSYFIQQNDWGTYKPTAFRDDDVKPKHRNRFQWKHRIDFDSDTVGMLEMNKMSDEYVLKDYFYNEYEENNVIPDNYISVISAKRNYIFSIMGNRRLDDFYTVTQRLPEAKLEIPDQRLWNTPLYYGSEMSATRFEKEYAWEKDPPEDVNRFDTYHKLSYVGKLGPVNLTPFGEIRETLYSRTRWDGDDITARTSFSGGIKAFSRLSRIFDFNTDKWGFDINKLRHIIVPSVLYFHRHQPTVDKDNLLQMDALDKLEKENYVNLALENKLQTKRSGGKVVDLVRFITSVDFLWRMKKNNYQFEEDGKFRNLKFDLELSPYPWLYIDTEMEVAPKNQAVATGSLEATIHPVDWFNMALGYRYEKMMPEPRNQLTFDLWCRLNPKWKFGWYERFDLQKTTIEEQQFSIVRDLHCWEVEVVCDIDGPNPLQDELTFWLAFTIKAFPDLQLGLSRSFTKRPPGSLRR